MSEGRARLAAVRRYTGLDAPVDGAFERTARMAAKIFAAPMATVSVVDEDRVRFLATTGLDGVTEVGVEPGLCVSAILGPGVYVVPDAAADPRTAEHPWVSGDLAVRFYAAAAIVTSGGHALGTVDVLDVKRRRRITATQTSLLTDLADSLALVIEIRLSAVTALAALRTSHVAATDRRDVADQLRERMSQAAEARHARERPQWCQLGGADECRRSADMKVADSWGDSAWGCWQHAEDALINVPSVFLATDDHKGLTAYRSRALPPV